MIFIDTGAFLARHHGSDQYHAEAVRKWRELTESNLRLFTSNIVIVETITLLARRLSHPFAAERARNMYADEEVSILRPAAEDERAAIPIFEKYADVRVSFTDCITCVLMRRHKIRRVFGFDRHFADMGFEFL